MKTITINVANVSAPHIEKLKETIKESTPEQLGALDCMLLAIAEANEERSPFAANGIMIFQAMVSGELERRLEADIPTVVG